MRAPAGGADSIKLLRSGRADLAYLDIHDLAIADAKAPGELVGVMALVQRPLAAAAGRARRSAARVSSRAGAPA